MKTGEEGSPQRLPNEVGLLAEPFFVINRLYLWPGQIKPENDGSKIRLKAILW